MQSKASDHADISARDRFGQRLWLFMSIFICIKEQKSSNGSGPKWSCWEEGSVMRPECVLQNHLNMMMNHGLQVLDLGIWFNVSYSLHVSFYGSRVCNSNQQYTLLAKPNAEAKTRHPGTLTDVVEDYYVFLNTVISFVNS